MTRGFWRDRPVLVTGAHRAGGRLADAPPGGAGADVVCLVRDWVPQSELVRAGLIERVNGGARRHARPRYGLERAIGEYEIDTVIHLAAQTIVGIANRNPVSTFESNIQGTWNLLEACRRSPRRAVDRDRLVGQGLRRPGDAAVHRRRRRCAGRHPYDVSKSCADLIAQTYADTYGLPVAVTRCGNFYGGGDLNWNRIVPGTIRSVLRGERPVIRSDGQYIRDYFYVEDGAAAYMLLAERLHRAARSCAAQAFNFSNESQVTVLDLVNRILRGHGVRRWSRGCSTRPPTKSGASI